MNLFLISAPYQVLNALEVVHHLQLDTNHLRVIDTGHFTREQFANVIDPSCWASVRYHNFRYRMPHRDFGARPPGSFTERLLELWQVADQALKRWRAERIAAALGEVNYLVLGNYRRYYDGHMRHFANRLHCDQVVLLDVGTDTLRINQDRHADKEGSPTLEEVPAAGAIKQLKHWIKRRFVTWDTRGAASVTFFSTYDLPLAAGDRLLRNSYSYLQQVVAEATPSDKVFFVGQPLVDQAYLTRESFAEGLRRIRDHFAGQRLVYVPHPRESQTQLQIVQGQGFAIERFTAPFEYAVSFSGERPRGIASFFSSAVENSATIFGTTLRVYAFRLPERLLLKDQASVSGVYAQFAARTQGLIEVVDVFAA